jgi:glycosyltransferase involved in cell wall biosynthesis
MNKPAVTFLLPGDNRSGGVRVTAVMGNLLLERGYVVRIAHPAPWRRLWSDPRSFLPPVLIQNHGWLHIFKGPITPYSDLNRIHFAPGEIVIAVGTYMIADLQKLRTPHIVKVRYNHGFPAQMTPAYRAAWSLPLPTITVSPTLVPQLEWLSGQTVRAVIPNGIDPSQYFPVPGVTRDAIGTIFSQHPNKAPHDIVQLLQRARELMPDVPRVVFGMDKRPDELAGCHYERAPSIAHVRELYSRAMVWLLASHTEGLPGPVLEAMACGAAVVSTDNDGSRAVIHDGENGFIVPKGDVAAFMERIQRIRSNRALRARLVGGGFATVARFSWQSAADRMDAFLQTLAPQPARVAS